MSRSVSPSQPRDRQLALGKLARVAQQHRNAVVLPMRLGRYVGRFTALFEAFCSEAASQKSEDDAASVWQGRAPCRLGPSCREAFGHYYLKGFQGRVFIVGVAFPEEAETVVHVTYKNICRFCAREDLGRPGARAWLVVLEDGGGGGARRAAVALQGRARNAEYRGSLPKLLEAAAALLPSALPSTAEFRQLTVRTLERILAKAWATYSLPSSTQAVDREEQLSRLPPLVPLFFSALRTAVNLCYATWSSGRRLHRCFSSPADNASKACYGVVCCCLFACVTAASWCAVSAAADLVPGVDLPSYLSRALLLSLPQGGAFEAFGKQVVDFFVAACSAAGRAWRPLSPLSVESLLSLLKGLKLLTHPQLHSYLWGVVDKVAAKVGATPDYKGNALVCFLLEALEHLPKLPLQGSVWTHFARLKRRLADAGSHLGDGTPNGYSYDRNYLAVAATLGVVRSIADLLVALLGELDAKLYDALCPELVVEQSRPVKDFVEAATPRRADNPRPQKRSRLTQNLYARAARAAATVTAPLPPATALSPMTPGGYP